MANNARKFSFIALLADIVAAPFEAMRWVLKQVDNLLYKAVYKLAITSWTLTTKGIKVGQHEALTKAQEDEIIHVLSGQYTNVMVNPLGIVTGYKINDYSGTLYIIGTTAQILKSLGVVFEAEEMLDVELLPLQPKK